MWIYLLMANLLIRKLHHYSGQFFLYGIGSNCIFSSSTEFWCLTKTRHKTMFLVVEAETRFSYACVMFVTKNFLQLCGARFLQQITCQWLFDIVFSQPVHTGSGATFTRIILIHACKELSLSAHFVVWCSLCLLCAYVCILHRYVLLLFIPAT